PSTAAVRTAYGRRARIRCWASARRAPATIFMARVIFCVPFTLEMRRRIALRLGMLFGALFGLLLRLLGLLLARFGLLAFRRAALARDEALAEIDEGLLDLLLGLVADVLRLRDVFPDVR